MQPEAKSNDNNMNILAKVKIDEMLQMFLCKDKFFLETAVARLSFPLPISSLRARSQRLKFQGYPITEKCPDLANRIIVLKITVADSKLPITTRAIKNRDVGLLHERIVHAK